MTFRVLIAKPMSALLVACALFSTTPAQALAEEAQQKCATTVSTNTPTYIEEGQQVVRLKSKSPSFVCTPWLQIHSTDCLLVVQSSPKACRIAVLKGTATIKNTQEKHIIQLPEGVVYESIATGFKGNASRFDRIRDLKSTPLTLFQTKAFMTALFIADADAATKLADGEAVKFSHAPYKQARVISPPTTMNYSMGTMVASTFDLPPQIIQSHPPAGFIVQTTESFLAGSDTEPQ